MDSEYKLRQNVKIAMLYLEDDDPINAEAFLKKASALITSCKVRAGGFPFPETDGRAHLNLLCIILLVAINTTLQHRL